MDNNFNAVDRLVVCDFPVGSSPEECRIAANKSSWNVPSSKSSTIRLFVDEVKAELATSANKLGGLIFEELPSGNFVTVIFGSANNWLLMKYIIEKASSMGLMVYESSQQTLFMSTILTLPAEHSEKWRLRWQNTVIEPAKITSKTLKLFIEEFISNSLLQLGFQREEKVYNDVVKGSIFDTKGFLRITDVLRQFLFVDVDKGKYNQYRAEFLILMFNDEYRDFMENSPFYRAFEPLLFLSTIQLFQDVRMNQLVKIESILDVFSFLNATLPAIIALFKSVSTLTDMDALMFGEKRGLLSRNTIVDLYPGGIFVAHKVNNPKLSSIVSDAGKEFAIGWFYVENRKDFLNEFLRALNIDC